MTKQLDLDALQAAAETATPGPWRECGHDRGGCECAQVWSTTVDFPVATAFKGDDEIGQVPDGKPQANARYIAAANPAVILALIDRLRKAEAAREGYKWVPVEPTWEIICAMREADRTAEAVYRAMLAAAPDSTPTDSADSEGEKG